MPKSVEAIVSLYKYRKEHEAPWRERALEVREVYNHEASVPLPELDKREKVFVANLLAQGLDQEAARIASTVPNVVFPPTKIGSRRSQDQAQTRRKATLGWWSQNNMKIKMRRRARWLIGYASAPAWISWDFERGIPRWDIRDPLNTYPAPTNDPDEFCPPDCIFAFTRSLRWLKSNYPQQAAGIYTGRNPNLDEHYTVLRYDDAAECVLVLLAKTMDPRDNPDWTTGTEPLAELERYENRTGMCLVVEPGRVNLDRPQGQFDGMVGMYQQQAMLQALEVLAVKRSIFPDEWVMGDQQVPQIISTANGLTGEIGVIRGGKLVSNQYVPGPQAPQAIDRLERNQRVTAGIPPDFGGESGSNIRTGKRGDAILSAAIDFPIQEAQEILAVSLQEENRRAIAVAKAYGGNQPKSFWVPWKGVNTRVDYVPNQIFDTDENYCAYCVDAETEILTARGWKTHDRLRVDEPVLTLNPETGLSEWQPCEAVNVFPAVRRDLVLMEGQGHSSLTTPNHRWLVRKPRWKRTGPKAVRIGYKSEFTTTDGLKIHDAVPLCAPHAQLPIENKFSDSLVEVVAWFWTEGHILTTPKQNTPCGASICQSQKNAPHVERIRGAITGLFGPSVESLRTVGRFADREPRWRCQLREGKWEFFLSATAARIILQHAPGRVPTFDFLLSLTSAQLGLFIQCSVWADGSRYEGPRNAFQVALSQKDRKAAEAFQFACTLAGHATSLKSSVVNGIEMHKVYVRTRTTVRPKAAAGKRQGFTITTVPHDGIVWCPTTANGTWLARRRGNVYFTGNSHSGADVNSLIIGIGQRIGTGLLSKQTGREIDPLIDDPELENDRITGEAIDGAVLAAFTTQAQQGAIPPIDAARVRELVVSNKMDLSEAIEKAHQESQDRQAQEVPQGAPGAQPGLGAPGQGAEQPTIPDQRGSGMGNLSMLLNNLRRPQMQGSGEALGEQALQGQGAA